MCTGYLQPEQVHLGNSMDMPLTNVLFDYKERIDGF